MMTKVKKNEDEEEEEVDKEEDILITFVASNGL